MKAWVNYRNGNYNVCLNLINGTKIRQNSLDYFLPSTIESCDIKITNRCYGGTSCKFCHEGSSPFGKHGDILSPSWLDKLHPYTELAIGGGNPLCHPDLDKFLLKCRERLHIPNMTVNQIHFEKEFDRVKKLYDEHLIFGLGISLVKVTPEFIEKVKQIPSAVIHVINGIVTEEELRQLRFNGLKILILGYKVFRRGEKLYQTQSKETEEKKAMLKGLLPVMLEGKWFEVISFDNLSLSQLDLRSYLSKEDWQQFYMGNDGLDSEEDCLSATYFVDMVERKFAINSCSKERYDLLNTAEEMYEFLWKDKLTKLRERAAKNS